MGTETGMGTEGHNSYSKKTFEMMLCGVNNQSQWQPDSLKFVGCSVV